MVAWGNDYVTKLLDYALPSLIACVEASAFDRNHECRLFIHTRSEDRERLESTEIFDQIRAVIPTEICEIELTGAGKYRQVSVEHATATNRARTAGACVMFLSPDVIWSVELLSTVANAIRDGKTALFVLGFRTRFEALGSILDAERQAQSGQLALRSRQAVKLALEYLHPENTWLFWNAGATGSWISQVYFGYGQAGLYAACWQLHPIMIRPAHDARAEHTIDDGRYLEAVLDDLERVEVITDSDRGTLIELTSETEVLRPARRGPMTIGACVKWALQHARPINRLLFLQIIHIHTGDIDRSAHELRSSFVNEIVSEIVKEYDIRKSGSWLAMISGLSLKGVLYGAIVSTLRLAHFIKRFVIATVMRLARFVVRLLMRLPGMRPLVARILRSGQARRVAIQILSSTTPGGIGSSTLPEEDTIFGQFASSRALRFLDQGNLKDAQLLMRVSRHLALYPERIFYDELITTLLALKADAETRATEILARDEARFTDEPIVLAVVVWGKEYVDAFLGYTLRTMLSPGNLPALAGRRIIFSIVTDAVSRELFVEHEVFPALQALGRVEFFVFPTHLTDVGHYSAPTFNFYRLYGALDHTSIHFARALRAHIFFVVADALYADGTVPRLLDYLEHGYDVCVNASLVAKKQEILPILDGKIGADGSIDMSSRDLANLCFRCRHDYISQRLMTADNGNFDKYPRELYFPDLDGLVVHALYQHPWAISSRAICRNLEFDYHIVDFRLVSRIFAGASSFERLKVVEDSAEVFIANFAPEERQFDTTGEPFNVRNFVSVHLHSQPIHWHIWRHRQIIRCDTMLAPEKNSEIIAANILNALKQAVAKQ